MRTCSYKTHKKYNKVNDYTKMVQISRIGGDRMVNRTNRHAVFSKNPILILREKGAAESADDFY